MTSMIQFITLVSSLMLVSFSHASGEKHSDHKHTHSTIKPGANIVLSHNYDGHTALGEIETFSLSLAPQGPKQGRIDISLHAEAGYALQSQSEFAMPLDGSPIVIPVTLTAMEDGKHYLGVRVTTTSQKGIVQARVFELAISAGNTAKGNLITKSSSIQKSGKTKFDSGVVIMPSREKISQEK